MKLSTSNHQKHPNSIIFSLQENIQLTDWLGRAIRKDKPSYIPSNEPPILQKLNIANDGFIELMKAKDDLSKLTIIGSPTSLTHYLENAQNHFVKGINLSKQVFS
ncbi:hypothetical protein [Aliikangiella maris]|uniref:Uncharacterized protein n=2 Tax=Aliikangiella maris TaxID=3162458 RepID=A0ABV2BVZ2_9GAMM